MKYNFLQKRTQRITDEGEIYIYTEIDIEGMRAAGSLAALVLDFIEPHIKPGISTKKLDLLCYDFIKEHGGNSACLGYNDYPATICSSVNQVVCHGIPTVNKILKNGDIINIDLVVELDGWHGDTSRTFAVGEISDNIRQFLKITKQAMDIGIEEVKPGKYTGDIGMAIAEFVAPFGYGIVRDYSGHGIGLNLHEAPNILHYATNTPGVELVPGMCLTVEPMLNLGSHKVKLLRDGWTVVTKDKSLSAQFEHTLVVTCVGHEILTSNGLKNSHLSRKTAKQTSPCV